MTNELTDVRCPCGTEFPAESYDAGFIAGSGMCQNCDAALPPKDICTCPSGDGSLRHPCPAHPAPVEQAGGDERAAFRPAQVISYRPGVGEVTIYVAGRVPGYMNIGDTVYVSDRAPVEQPIAALAQPSPKCTTCGGAGMVDDGEITCSEGGIPYENGPVKCVKDCPDCAQPSQAQAEQAEAEAERPELWAVHAQGPDELYAAFSRADAEKHAAELNCLPVPVSVSAVVIPSPWPPAEHWQYLAEQERDHKNEIAVRLRQFERICEGLPQDAIDGGWTVQGIRGYAKRLEDQLKAAQAQHSVPGNAAAMVRAEGKKYSLNAAGMLDSGAPEHAQTFAIVQLLSEFDDEEAESHWEAIMAYSDFRTSDALFHAAELLAAAPGKEVPQAWLDVQAERRRQVEVEGWTPEHDDAHSHGEMARAAACYALAGSSAPNDGTAALMVSLAWPWDEQWWKPSTARRDMVKACALALAEIERLDRAGISQNPQPGATTASS
ncbi:hypothetical protein [Pseudomonas aeruginosa]|uniref:hypothetical protein n=1 Tax=Pseudomonas aeruginosa TaxID=287 RepID=UPI0021ADD48D|nr:hypothetical protein [Pseudomonas aeruginosa]